MISYLLIISSKAPYHSSAAMDAFEAALAASNVGMEVKFLFQHDGVFQLLHGQDSTAIEHKSMYKKLSALALFDVEDIYVCKASIESRGLRLTQNDIKCSFIAPSELVSLTQAAQQVLVF